jgi:putative inorganic carbon (hco3(-)) transporter
VKSAYAVATDWWRPDTEAQERVPAPALASAGLERSASPLAYGAFVAFTCVLLLAPQNFFPILGRLRIAMLAGTIAIVAHLRERWAVGLPLTKPSREMTIAGILLVWTLLGMPFSQWPGGSLALFLDLYIKALAVFWMMGNLVDTLPRLRGMALTLTLLTVALALVGISNYATGVFGPTQDRRIVGYDAGLTRNPNDLALMLNLVLPMAIALLLSSAGTLVRLALGCAVALQAVAVILTFSRAGFLTLATTLGLYGMRLMRRPGRGLVFVALGGILLALPFMPSGYLDRLLTLSAIDADPTGSAQARWEGTRAALEHAVEHPILGAGLGMNILVLNESVGATWRAVHNTYLEYAVDLGLPGLTLFVLLLYGCWKNARATRRQAGPELGQLAEGIEISLVGFAVAAFFHPAAYEFYFFYIAGLAAAATVVGARTAAATA